MGNLAEARAIHPELVSLRRDIHQHPETGFEVDRTAGLVARYLKSCDLEVREGVGRSGVVGVLRADKPKETLAFRAELDALEMDEENELGFKSINPGKAHTCGHDAHLAMLLGSVKILARNRKSLRKEIRFLFQPSEEKLPGGAQAMIADGALEGVDECFAIHVTPMYETGIFGTRVGPILAAPDNFEVRIIGRGGHAGAPHLSIDPVMIGAQIIQAIQNIASRETDPLQSLVVSVCTVHAGTTHNVIPDTLTLEGTIRTLTDEIRDGVAKRLEEVVRGVTQAHRASYEFHFQKGYPVTVNHADSAAEAKITIERLFGKDAFVEASNPIMAGDDFAYFLQKAKGSLLFMGCRKSGLPIFPNHHPRFMLDENCLPLGTALFCQLANLT